MSQLAVEIPYWGQSIFRVVGGLVAVLAGGVRVEGLTIADDVELARRLS